MSTLAITSAIWLASQAITSVPGPEVAATEQKEVAYEALSRGDGKAAQDQLEARMLQDPADPALLINLGSAYAQNGRMERAAAAYRAALDSDTRYELELADGSWVDSRRAARMALAAIQTGGALAAR